MIKGIKAPIIADQASEMSGCTRAQYVYLVPWPGNNYEIISCSIWQNFWIIKRKNMRDISILKEKPMRFTPRYYFTRYASISFAKRHLQQLKNFSD